MTQASDSSLVSVLIPCYNAEKYVEEAVNSVLNQTYRNIEVIAIDDCSTDRTYELLQQMALTDPRLKLYRNEVNKGLIGTLNFGINECTGGLIARMDADDVCHPDRIRQQVERLLETNVDVVGCFSVSLNEDSSVHSLHTFWSVASYRATLFVFLIECAIPHSGALCKKSVLEEARYFSGPDVIHAEDYDIWSRLLREGKKIESIPDYLLFVRRNTQSVSHKYRDTQNRNQQLISAENCKSILHISVPEELHTLILSKGKIKVSGDLVYEALRYLQKLRDVFYQTYPCEPEDKKQIGRWISGRFLRIIIFHILSSRSLSSILQGGRLFLKFRRECMSGDMVRAVEWIVRSQTQKGKYRV